MGHQNLKILIVIGWLGAAGLTFAENQKSPDPVDETSVTACDAVMSGNDDFVRAMSLLAGEKHRELIELLPRLKLSNEIWITLAKVIAKGDRDVIFKALPKVDLPQETLLTIYSSIDYKESYDKYHNDIGVIPGDKLKPNTLFPYVFGMRRNFGNAYKVEFSLLTPEQRLIIAQADIEKELFENFNEGRFEQYLLLAEGQHDLLGQMFIGLAKKDPRPIVTELNDKGKDSPYYEAITSLTKEDQFTIFKYLALSQHYVGQVDFSVSDPFQQARLERNDGKSKKTVTLDFLKHFDLTPTQIAEILSVAIVTHAGENVEVSFSKNTGPIFRSLSPNHRRQILLSAVQNLPLDSIRNSKALDAFIHQNFGGTWGSINTPEIRDTLMRRDPLTQILRDWNLERKNLSTLNFASKDERELTLRRIMENFAEDHPEALEDGLPQLFWDVSRDADVVRNLIRYYYDFLPYREGPYRQGYGYNRPTDSTELFCHIVGINYEDFVASKIARRPVEFFKIAFELQAALSKPIFAEIAIDPQLFDQKYKLIALLNDIRNFLGFTNKVPEAWQSITADMRVQGINSENIDQLHNGVKDRLNKKITAMFKNTSYNPNLIIDYDKFMKVIENWGNVEPILTLVSRFAAESRWAKELPTLFTVVEQVLEDKFEYHRYHKKYGQVDHLNVEQIRNWTQDRFRLGFAGETKSTTDLFDHANSIYSTNLLPHIERSIENYGKVSLSAEEKNRLSLQLSMYITIGYRHHFNKIKEKDLSASVLIDHLNSDFPVIDSRQASLFAIEQLSSALGVALEERLLESDELSRLLGLLQIFLKSQKAATEDTGMLQQALADVDDLQNILKIKPTKEPGQSGGIILSVLSSDPKEMLTIGDAVDCSSCQNYSSGGMIASLLGYVMDGNIRALLSFHIKQSHFDKAEDYNRLANAMRAGKEIDVKWNGNKKVATFNWVDPTRGNRPISVKTAPLRKAHLRNILRLGKIELKNKDGGSQIYPGLHLERDYLQNHQNLSQMKDYHIEMAREVEELINGKRGTITFPKSRNPGGVYTDAGGGTKTDTYTLNNESSF